ncbi:MAG: 4-hydroxy-tetrahydrodipicolinate synthase [Fimbriimonadaceae bacterium]|nr:MAG: 4-hydroxy-tetrahydrodipicolinate synthase [Fimbriimonadaceae bacterium]
MGAFTASRDWGQLLTAMLTPFTSSNEVNIAEAKRIAAYLVDVQKNDGIVVAGTTGESPTLKHDEKLALLDATLEEVGDRAAVVMGTGTYDTAESIEMTKAAEKAGAHGIMLVNPYYSRPGQEGLYAHFSTIAKETNLPVMLYNIQPRSAINLETETLLRLAEIPNIVAVKEASGNIAQINDVCRLAPKGFRVYSGDDALLLPILSVGGHGLVSVAAHVVGTHLKSMITDFPTNPAKATATAHSITSFVQAIFSYPSPVPIKYALSKKGFDCESVRLPLVGFNDEQRKKFDAIMQQIPS